MTVGHPDDELPYDVNVEDPIEPQDVDVNSSQKNESSSTTITSIAIDGDKSNMHTTVSGITLK
jgi:hypothetical protein